MFWMFCKKMPGPDTPATERIANRVKAVPIPGLSREAVSTVYYGVPVGDGEGDGDGDGVGVGVAATHEKFDRTILPSWSLDAVTSEQLPLVVTLL
jgi:hypothetical protein